MKIHKDILAGIKLFFFLCKQNVCTSRLLLQ